MNPTITIKAALKGNVPLLLEGPTGVGKTYLIQDLAKAQNKTLHVINVSGELTVDAILGAKTLVDGNVQWRDGTLTRAMRQGDWVLFDELNTALPEVLTIINGVLDDSRAVTLPNDDAERVMADPEFRFVGTQNPASGEYAGTGRLNSALLNRMIRVTMDYLDTEAEVSALKKHTKLGGNTVLQLVRLAQFTRKNFDEKLSTRDLVKILRLKEAGGLSLRDAIATVALTRFSNEEYRELYERHNTIMREISELGIGDKDPWEAIRERLAEIRKREDELAREKDDIRTSVKSEILRELLGGGVKAGTAKEL